MKKKFESARDQLKRYKNLRIGLEHLMVKAEREDTCHPLDDEDLKELQKHIDFLVEFLGREEEEITDYLIEIGGEE